MKKALLLIVLALTLSLTACSNSNDDKIEFTPTPQVTATPEPTADPTPEPTAEPIVEPTAQPTPEVDTTKMNLLTGEINLSDKAIGTRPVAIMINNLKNSLPQYGISDADIIFECPVEANITRLMAIYADYTAVPDICSVRSCRYYYPTISEGFDAFYVHWGAEKIYGTGTINKYGIDDLDGMCNSYKLFGRDKARRDEGYPLEHTSMFYGSKLAEKLENSSSERLELKEDKTDAFFKFTNKFSPANGSEIHEFSFDFGSYYSDFEYNEETKTYFKYHNGSKHIDSSTDEWLNFTNVIVLETDVSLMEEGGKIKKIDVTGTNKSGYYLSGGNVQKITWSKADIYDKIHLYDETGDELSINTGKSYFAVGEIEYNSDLFN